MITNVFIAFGVMMIPVSFLLLTTHVSEYWIWASGIIGFIALISAVFRANNEDNKADRDRKSLNKILKAIAIKMGVDEKDIE